MNKIIMIAIMAISMNIYADNPHHDEEKESVVTNTSTSIYNEYNIQSAIAIAAGQHHFDYGTYAYQKSVTAAVYGDSSAVSAALAHRECRDCGLFSASISAGNVNNDTQIGIGIGYTWSY